ncbi:MAG: putative transcriptional regulator [Lachnospiraceae bacterium]|jgi:DNA-binding transcriptional MerR regulator|nr:putative transcriptional regulator [Lachnospiraceae bacterium]
MIYTIGEMSKHLNVAASTLRYYDKEGLLPFVERSGGGMRMFKESDLPWLQLIDCLKKTGMPIKDIKYFMDCCMEGDSKIDERLFIVKEQRDSVIKQMEELQDMLDMLNYKCWFYETARDAGTCAIHDDIQKENVPKEYLKYMNEK